MKRGMERSWRMIPLVVLSLSLSATALVQLVEACTSQTSKSRCELCSRVVCDGEVVEDSCTAINACGRQS